MASRALSAVKATRCKATEGAQQCLSAQHGKLQSHRWGAKGETDQWNADGTPKPPARHDDTPTVEVPALATTFEAVVPATIAPPNGDPTQRGYGDLIRVLEHGNHKRFDIERVIELRGIIDQLERELDRWELSDPTLIAKGFHQFESWALQRGLRQNGDGS
jgi:hypothetical protein